MREGDIHDCFLRIESELHQCRIALSIVKGFHVEADLKGRNVLGKEWSVDEDKLLLMFEESHEQHWIKGYKLARKENPKLFNKSSITESDLRDRVAALKTNSSLQYRYKLLKKDVESSIVPLDADASVDMSRSRNDRSFQDQSAHLQQFKPLSKLHKDVVIRLISRAGDTTSVEGNAHALSTHSPHLKSLLQSAAPNKYDVKTIQLSERDRTFNDYPELFDVFGPDNVNKYVEFTENPQLWNNKEKAEEQLTTLKKDQNSMWHVFQENLELTKARYVQLVKDLRSKEEESLEKECKACLEEDIKQLTYLHQAHLQAEMAKLSNRYDAIMTDVNEFYANEHSRLSELNLRYDETERVSVEQQLLEAEFHIKNIFPDNGLLRLLVLSDVLRDSDLRTACLQRIAAKITKFYKAPELGCQLMRSKTLEELFSMCNAQQLVAMQHGRDFQFKEELLQKEIASRQATQREAYKGWSIKELTEAQMSEKVLWPQLLDEEINRRRDQTIAYVTIDMKKLNTLLVSVDKELRTATLMKPHKYAAVVATHSRQSGGWGKWYWECKIPTFERSSGCSISIGWDAPRQNYQESYLPGLQPGMNGDFGCVWTSDGLLHYNGAADDVFATFDKDDVVGCGLDQDRGLFTFYKNGTQIALVKKKMEVKMPDAYNLFPCVCMYSARLKQSVRVVLEFCGPFSFRVPKFFRPYGDCNAHTSVVVKPGASKLSAAASRTTMAAGNQPAAVTPVSPTATSARNTISVAAAAPISAR